MEARCRCGGPIAYPFHQFGCIQCGAGCCPACAFPLESATYCARCAESILEVPWGSGWLAAGA
jgi:hypothetical protein